MYLMIENDSVIQSNVCSENDKKDADNHYTLLIDITDKFKPIQYCQGSWWPIAEYGRK